MCQSRSESSIVQVAPHMGHSRTSGAVKAHLSNAAHSLLFRSQCSASNLVVSSTNRVNEELNSAFVGADSIFSFIRRSSIKVAVANFSASLALSITCLSHNC